MTFKYQHPEPSVAPQNDKWGANFCPNCGSSNILNRAINDKFSGSKDFNLFCYSCEMDYLVVIKRWKK